MGSQKLSILIISFLSLMVVIGTFIGAFCVSETNRKGKREELSQTQYSSFPKSEQKPVENSSSSKETNISEEQTSTEETELIIEQGTYVNGNDTITVNGSDNGFVDIRAVCGGIVMEFSGQAVDGVLVATGTDSIGNTVEATLTFSENTITAQSEPITMYEGATQCIEITGIFIR